MTTPTLPELLAELAAGDDAEADRCEAQAREHPENMAARQRMLIKRAQAVRVRAFAAEWQHQEATP